VPCCFTLLNAANARSVVSLTDGALSTLSTPVLAPLSKRAPSSCKISTGRTANGISVWYNQRASPSSDERISCIFLFPDYGNIPVPLLVRLMNQYLKRRCFQLSSYGTKACLCFSLAGRFLPVLLRSKAEYEAFFPLKWTSHIRMRLPTKQASLACAYCL
jgi:hypothetical protein